VHYFVLFQVGDLYLDDKFPLSIVITWWPMMFWGDKVSLPCEHQHLELLLKKWKDEPK
jgi:hypothetical protein